MQFIILHVKIEEPTDFSTKFQNMFTNWRHYSPNPQIKHVTEFHEDTGTSMRRYSNLLDQASEMCGSRLWV